MEQEATVAETQAAQKDQVRCNTEITDIEEALLARLMFEQPTTAT